MRLWRAVFILSAVVLAMLAWKYHRDETKVTIQLPVGAPLDTLDGVIVHHNGGMNNVLGRNVVDGYNVGLKYQCVEFVKRYYLEHFNHRMPNSYGHAKDFFDAAITDGGMNPARGLLQFVNNSASQPRAGDLLVLDGWKGNPYGHVAIVAEAGDGELEVVQQNCGTTRETFDLDQHNGKWRVDSKRVLGWLRMP